MIQSLEKLCKFKSSPQERIRIKSCLQVSATTAQGIHNSNSTDYRIETQEMFPNTCYEVNRTLLPKPDMKNQKEKLQATETKVSKYQQTNLQEKQNIS